jgi:hypothetical protein
MENFIPKADWYWGTTSHTEKEYVQITVWHVPLDCMYERFPHPQDGDNKGWRQPIPEIYGKKSEMATLLGWGSLKEVFEASNKFTPEKSGFEFLCTEYCQYSDEEKDYGTLVHYRLYF